MADVIKTLEQLDGPDEDQQAPPDGRYMLKGPGLYPLTGQELVQWTVNGGLAGVTVKVRARTINQKGLIQRHERTIPAPSNRVPTTLVMAIGDGFLLDITARVTAGAPLIGQTSVVADLIQGLSGELQPITTLCGGYVTANTPLVGPSENVVDFFPRQGAVRSITGTDPAAGVECSDTVPAGARWMLLAWRVVLSTSAVVANRSTGLTLDDGANIFYQAGTGFPITASQVTPQAWGPAVGTFGNPGVCVVAPLPSPVLLLAGWRIRTVTQAMDAGDNYGPPQFAVQEWLEG